MRKLNFTVDSNHQRFTQENNYVLHHFITDLLSDQLIGYGFKTEKIKNQEGHLAIQVESNPIELIVHCQDQNQQGLTPCAISAHANEEQEWFAKIETQSVIKQLAQAVEETLKKENGFASFVWQNN